MGPSRFPMMNAQNSYRLTAEYACDRLDRFLCEYIGDIVEDEGVRFTRSYIQKLITGGSVSVNGVTVTKKSLPVKAADVVEITETVTVYDIKPQNIPLDIIYEDNDLLVVNKPRGMTVHPAPGNPDGTLVNAIMYHCGGSLSAINGVLRPGIVHRIDKDTGGLLVVAKNDRAHLLLAAQLAEHSMLREYRSIVYGNIKDDSGRIDLPIGRSERDRKKYCVTEKNSKRAVTNFEVIERLKNFTYIACRLETGRTHQIRVHMAHIGHPLAGDPLYGPRHVISSLGGQCLQAVTLGFVHPATGEQMLFTSELPFYFTDFINKNRG